VIWEKIPVSENYTQSCLHLNLLYFVLIKTMLNIFQTLQIHHKAHKGKQRFVFSLVFLVFFVVSAFVEVAPTFTLSPLFVY
jgi:hypothetical protein